VKCAAFVLLLLAGCKPREQYDRTPMGWHVHWEDQGTLVTGLHTKLQLFNLFDAAMERSFDECSARLNIPRAAVASTIKRNDALYELVDNFYFAVDPGSADAPDAVYASGITYNRVEVKVAFYSKFGGTSTPPAYSYDVPPWTVKQGPTTGLWYWGAEADGQQYPALGYELGWQFTDHQ
jgi:hypothetical protein